MIDAIEFSLPFGVVGQALGALVATPYLRRLLRLRNRIIKIAAEAEPGGDGTLG